MLSKCGHMPCATVPISPVTSSPLESAKRRYANGKGVMSECQLLQARCDRF